MESIEDKDFGGNKAYIDLTDIGVWGQSKTIEKHIGKENWVEIQKHVKDRVNGVCELCGANESKKGIFGQKAHKLKIEFRYSTDEKSKISTLKRMMYVCISCSQMIHLRQTQLAGIEPYKRAVERLCKINGLKPYQIEEELHKQQDIVKIRHQNGIPENLELYIIEDGTSRLWRSYTKSKWNLLDFIKRFFKK